MNGVNVKYKGDTFFNNTFGVNLMRLFCKDMIYLYQL